MDSTFLRHEHCPNCGSRDNLAIYTDHEWCFGCGYQVNYFNHYKLRLEKPLDISKNQVFLPEDIESYIPAVAENWLRKYELTTTELIKCQVVWSDKRQLLIFPYNDLNNQLVGWQGRYFGNKPDHPKWTGKGDFKKVNRIYSPTLKINNLTENTNNSIIVVEDIISTVKISRQYKSTCLFGSFINYNNLINIYNIQSESRDFDGDLDRLIERLDHFAEEILDSCSQDQRQERLLFLRRKLATLQNKWKHQYSG